MKYGNIDSPVNINNLWCVIEDSGEISGSAIGSYTFNNLDGDTDIEYKLICRFKNDTGSSKTYYLRFNSDSGNNYGTQDLQGESSVVAGSRATGQAWIPIGSAGDGTSDLTITRIYAKSGEIRILTSQRANNISNTTITNLTQQGSVWNNSADNITSINIVSNPAGGIDVGSRMILLKKVKTEVTKHGLIVPQGTIYGTWEKIYEADLGSISKTHTISSLNGDTDIIYRLIIRAEGNDAGNVGVWLNNDQTSSNYGFQYLNGSNTTLSALRATVFAGGLYHGNTGTAIQTTDSIIYVKSGYERPCLTRTIANASGTTITSVYQQATVWSNTVDEVTSMVINHSGTNGFDTGTHIELWRLNL